MKATGRLRRYVAIAVCMAALQFALGYAALGLYFTLTESNGSNLAGHRYGADFAGFYAAGSLAAAGRPETAYDLPLHTAAAQATTGAAGAPLPWLYPPVFLLVMELLAYLPYRAAFLLWTGINAMALLGAGLAMRLPHLLTALMVLMPASIGGLLAGQNAGLMAGLLGAGVALLPRQPVIAGIVLGTLAFKPHLALLVPVALVAARQWRALAACILTVLLLTVAGLWRYGVETWLAFVEALPTAMQNLSDGSAPWAKMVTVYAAARQLGFADAVAQPLQWFVGIAAIVVMVAIVRRGALPVSPGIAIACAALLTTPYALFYDTAMLAPAAAWLCALAYPSGWRTGERAILVMLWFAPVVFWQLAEATGVQPWPLLLALLLGSAGLRVRSTRSQQTSAALRCR